MFPEKLIYRLHAIKRMFERDISEQAVATILRNGAIIQRYEDDTPYPSYLLTGEYDKKTVHIVASIDNVDNATIIITAYIPDLSEWEPGYKVRRKK